MKTEERTFDSAEAFLSALRFNPTVSTELPWQQGGDARDWLFRGLAAADWRLIPSAMRPEKARPRSRNGITMDEWVTPSSEEWSHRNQICSEHALIWRFLQMTDAQGLPLPNYSPSLTRRLRRGRELSDERLARWPSHRLWPLVALAQHYLIPTRMLDWSRKPLVAAYFAAEDCAARAEHREAGDRLAVWVLDRRFVVSDATPELDLVTAPRAGNPNLHLQSGVFTVLRPALAPDSSFSPAPFDLQSYCEARGTENAKSVLWKLTLEAKEAGRLLTLLRDDFIQATTVYAGYQGAARSVLEQRLRRPC